MTSPSDVLTFLRITEFVFGDSPCALIFRPDCIIRLERLPKGHYEKPEIAGPIIIIGGGDNEQTPAG